MTVINLKTRKATQKFQPMISKNLFILQCLLSFQVLRYKILNITLDNTKT